MSEGPRKPRSRTTFLGWVFALLALAFMLLALVEWFAVLEPRLHSETRTTATALAYAQGAAVQRHLGSAAEAPPLDTLRDTLSGILLLTDNETGSPFFAAMELEFAEPWSDYSFRLGAAACAACFVDEVPLYARDTSELLGVLRVHSKPDFFLQMRRDTRQSLMTWFLGLMVVLLVAWRVLLRYERRTRESEAESAAVFSSSPVPLLLVNCEQMRVQRHNKAAAQLFSRANFSGLSCRTLFGDRAAEELRFAGEAGTATEIAVESGGHRIPLIATVTPLEDLDRPLTVIGLINISERKAIEQTLAAQKLESDSASAAKSAFLAAMSHEIRTPLNGILGFTHVLSDSPLDRDQREHLHLIELSARNLLAIIEDILDFSRIEAGKFSIRRAPTSLHLLLDETVRLFRNKAEEKGLELIYRAGPGLPETIETDNVRLRQVLGILIDNAIKFTPRGGLEVDASIDRGAGTLRLAVIDTGIGVPENEIERLFEPFYQVDRGVKRRFGGTGLGLVIARSIVTELGGSLEVYSRPGQGSTFSVTLPAGDVDQAPAEAPVSTHQRRWYALREHRVLVVDDDPVNARLLLYLLEARGLHTDWVESGDDALDCIEDTAYEVLFLDWHMPGRSGEEVLQAMPREAGNRLPAVVVTTGDVLREDETDLHGEGIVAILSKPIDVDRLDQVLELVLGAN